MATYARRLLLLTLIGAVVTSTTSSPVADVDVDGVDFRARRSLCNTFGGCGYTTKRAFQQSHGNYIAGVSGESPIVVGGSGGDIGERDPSPTMSNGRRDSSAGLIAEILSELLEYLETNEKYKNGKYIVMVPKSYDSSMTPSIMTLNMQSDNPADLQEPSLNRFHLGKNDRA